jgi:hypothetical protein
VALGEQRVAFDVGQFLPAGVAHGFGFSLTADRTARQRSRGCRDVRPYDRGSRASTVAVMFVRYYLELPLPQERVEQALLGSPPEWAAALAGDAQRRGEQLLAEVGVGPRGNRLGRRVAVQLGEPVRFPSMTSLPLTWEPLGLEGLLPRLEADIEIGPLGQDRTQLAISARYRPPLGAVGRAVDRVLLHRVAEATLKDFLDRVGEAITNQAVARG